MQSYTSVISTVIVFAGFVVAGILALFGLFSLELSTVVEHAPLVAGIAAMIAIYGFAPRLRRAAARRLARLRRPA